MKIALTGAAGNVTRPLAETLLAQGHQVTVIGRTAEHLQPLVDRGATAAIGSLEDAAFLTAAFRGADAVYTMVPFLPQLTDWRGYHETLARNYVRAVEANGIQKVVNLSTYGAHLAEGIGPVACLHRVEEVLNALKANGVAVVHLRAGYFYTNLLGQIPGLKQHRLLGANFGPDTPLLLVHPTDIAAVAAEALTNPGFDATAPRYVVSDVRTTADIAAAIGPAIGQPDLRWQGFPDEAFGQALAQAGLPAALIDVYLEMGQGLGSKTYQEHYMSLEFPPAPGRVKLAEYAREFAAVYAA